VKKHSISDMGTLLRILEINFAQFLL